MLKLTDKDVGKIGAESESRSFSLEERPELKRVGYLLVGAVFLLGVGFAAMRGDRGDRGDRGNQGKDQPRTTLGAGSGDRGIVFETEQNGGLVKRQSFNQKVVVDVGGAVLRPGVYELGENARVKDALVAAGGLAAEADREFVSRGMNLAASVPDGAKIYVPAEGDPAIKPPVGGSSGVNNVAGVSTQNSGLININTASAGELEKLKGIGEVRAGEIIDNRPYSKVEELRTKGVLGPKTFEKIRDEITVF